MTSVDPHLLVRAASIYVAAVLTVGAWAWRRPDARALTGAFLAFAWNLPALLVLHVVAAGAGWWQFDAEGGLLIGMPVDLWLSWAWLWGFVPAVAFRSTPLAIVIIVALALDLVLMPAGAPVVQLGPDWLVGEAAGLLLALVPAQLLARWTARGERLGARAALQAMAFSGILVFVLPAVAIAGSGGTWRNPLERPAWQISLVIQALAVPALIGLAAVQAFVERGRGTPLPFDPPSRLVTTGIYAYVRNPMQLSAVVMLALIGVAVGNPWVSVAGVMAHVFAAGLAGWDEDEDLRRRFGDAWTDYRAGVRAWLPRFRPWTPRDAAPARLFVGASCAMCAQVGGWFQRRGARNLVIVPADQHPSRRLTRITYEAIDDSPPATGVDAIARALEHVHLGWTLVACVVRLPVVRPAVQLLVDASGGEPRPIPSLH
jgi:protein-S-isoprenylcysteine O-methyltransferase Ste14